MTNANLLLTPVTIGGKTIQNRFAVGAMECNDSDDEGNPSDATYARYEKYFAGGSGFISLEAITCQRESVSSLHQLSVTPTNAKPLEKFVRHLKSINKDTIFVFQLTHSGEVGHPVLSKPVRVTEEPLYGYEHARLIGESEVAVIMDQIVEGAKIAHAAGADGIDLKLCTGYLGAQILRPFNKGNWKYGGSWEKRRQFAFDLTERIMKEVNDPTFIIGSKVTVYEGIPGGQGSAGPDTALMDLTESIDLVRGLEERGVSYIIEAAGAPRHTEDLSKTDRTKPYIGYLHFYFQNVLRGALKPETKVIGNCYSLYRDGGLKTFPAVKPENNTLAFWGNKNIQDGVVDLVSLGRQSLADPSVPKKMAENKDAEIKWCIGCDNCTVFLISQEGGGCAAYDPSLAEKLKEIKRRQ
ncbi:MAG: 2,4-dienoyl-CoA reductase [Clostridiales Family XIII bacterium]|jgi:2,4-dienoyl-CoA reductase-like NADH-dependent reductase (Old Yellow Enzyme family)|nr:2,4-dienoyl-CoA reductase [Clostridiales Family XIII bacterium]